ncbi:predicted protein [Naegleria gruberi]|uniref:Predicted protein n=1 Tax=Naegleria gruberi TaxID=5762 RepID=D2W1I5_NAEGR|nr:uncharacterized protein NAEGRDRAFT_75233 [Naegleria gruberi]EFC37051.1 predicted protein [Naegleria gruberi]|eukprot:XP_002669795.1 predicted protein [Naegleria gruberi strain NEG-M]
MFESIEITLREDLVMDDEAKVSFGKSSSIPYFHAFNGRIICHATPKEPLKLYPKYDWAIVELDITSRELDSLFAESCHFPPIPKFIIPTPSKVETSIQSDIYKYFSVLWFTIIEE